MLLLMFALSAMADEVDLDAYLALELPDPAAGATDAQLVEGLTTKTRALMQVRDDLMAHTTSQPAESAAAWQDIGRAYEDMAHELLGHGAPPRLTREQASIYAAATWDKGLPLCRNAKTAYDRAIDEAERAGLKKKAVRTAYQRSEALDPATHGAPDARDLDARVAAYLSGHPDGAGEQARVVEPEPADEPPMGVIGIYMPDGEASGPSQSGLLAAKAPAVPAPPPAPVDERTPEQRLIDAWSSPEALACALARDW